MVWNRPNWSKTGMKERKETWMEKIIFRLEIWTKANIETSTWKCVNFILCKSLISEGINFQSLLNIYCKNQWWQNSFVTCRKTWALLIAKFPSFKINSLQFPSFKINSLQVIVKFACYSVEFTRHSIHSLRAAKNKFQPSFCFYHGRFTGFW